MATAAQQAFERWGFTNDAQHIDAVRAWVDAALADGWSMRPTYGSEPMERAAHLMRDGFVVSVLTRDHGEGRKYRYEASLHAWGPDGLTVKVPVPYDSAALTAGVSRCNLCGAEPVKTLRYSFAGRCCEACIPTARAEYEKPGWDN